MKEKIWIITSFYFYFGILKKMLSRKDKLKVLKFIKIKFKFIYIKFYLLFIKKKVQWELACWKIGEPSSKAKYYKFSDSKLYREGK